MEVSRFGGFKVWKFQGLEVSRVGGFKVWRASILASDLIRELRGILAPQRREGMTFNHSSRCDQVCQLLGFNPDLLGMYDKDRATTQKQHTGQRSYT